MENHRLTFDWYHSRLPHPTRTLILRDVPQTANVNMLIADEPLQISVWTQWSFTSQSVTFSHRSLPASEHRVTCRSIFTTHTRAKLRRTDCFPPRGELLLTHEIPNTSYLYTQRSVVQGVCHSLSIAPKNISDTQKMGAYYPSKNCNANCS